MEEDVNEHRIKLITLTTFLLILIPLLSELLYGGKIPKTYWHFRIIDLIDITLMTPVYLIFFFLHYRESVEKLDGKFRYVYFAVLSLVIGGHFMHFTANALDTYMYEVKGYQVGIDIPPDIAETIYLLDEEISHYIMFSSIYILFTIIILGRYLWINSGMRIEQLTKKLNRVPTFLLKISGVFLGFGFSISFIEAQKAIFGLALNFILLLTIVIFFQFKRNKGKMPRNIVESIKDPIIGYFFLLALTELMTSLIYFMIFGSFVQPSELIRAHH